MTHEWTRSRRNAGVIAGALSIALVAAGCGSSEDSQKGGGEGGGPITFGQIVDLTGSLQGFNENAVPGYDFALEAITEKGGINGRPLEIIREDTGTENDQAPILVRKIAGTDAVLVLGPFSTTMLTAASPVADQMKIPVIAPTSIGRWEGEFNDWTFRLSPTTVVVLPDYMADLQEAWGLESLAVIFDQANDASATEASVLEEVVPDLGMTLTGTEALRTGDVDFSSQITNLLADDPDAVFVAAIDEEANLIMQQFRERGYEGEFISSSTLNDPGLLERSGGAALGVVTYQTVDVTGDDPELVALVDRYEDKYGDRNMPGLMATTYAAMQVAVDAVSRAEDPTDRQSVRDALAETEGLQTVIGEVTWDGSGDNQAGEYHLYQLVAPGQFVPFTGTRHGDL
jgi:branched-chain amino acid transport system substrate-binding protein